MVPIPRQEPSRYIVFGLAAVDPAEAERVLRIIPADATRDWFPPMIAWRMAAAEPVRARRLTDLSQRYFDHPQTYLFLAHGMKSLDRAGAVEAFHTAMQGIDRLMKDGAEYSLMLESRHVLLPMVEQIDAALVPEYFWRVVASRPSIGDPCAVNEASLSELVMLLAWYDRDVAEVVFERVRDQIERTDAAALARSANEFLSWSIFDPPAAVARLERVPVNLKRDLDADSARERVSEILRLPHEARWRAIWNEVTAMRELNLSAPLVSSPSVKVWRWRGRMVQAFVCRSSANGGDCDLERYLRFDTEWKGSAHAESNNAERRA